MNPTLLIIEDNLSFLVELRMELEGMALDIHSEDTEGGALIYLSEETPQMVLLDLKLGNSRSGPFLAEKLHRAGIPFVVMTQFREDEIYNEVVKFHPIAYYTKPLDYISLKYQIKRLMTVSSDDDAISVKWKTTYIRIPFSEISYFNGEGNYVTIVCDSGERYAIRKSLKAMLLKLPKREFIRVHRNYVVKVKNILSYNFKDNEVLLHNLSIPVGRSYRTAIRNRLKE